VAVNDTEITKWSVTSANNAPADSDKIQSDFAAQFRNLKGVYKNDVSLQKGFLSNNPSTAIAEITGGNNIYTITCFGNWLSYLQKGRKIKFYNDVTGDALYGHVVHGGNFSGETAAYVAYYDVTVATVNIFGNFTTYYNRVSFGVDNSAPAVFPFTQISGKFKYTNATVTGSDSAVEVGITFPAYATANTVDNSDPPGIIFPRNIYTSGQKATDNTNRGFCVDAFATACVTDTNSTNMNSLRVEKVYKLHNKGLTVVIGGNPANGQTDGDTYYVTIEWSVISAAEHLPIAAQGGRLGYYYPGVA
jgi:hypothetical protein